MTKDEELVERVETAIWNALETYIQSDELKAAARAAIDATRIEELLKDKERLTRAGDELADKLWILRCEAHDRKSCEAAEKALAEWRAALSGELLPCPFCGDAMEQGTQMFRHPPHDPLAQDACILEQHGWPNERADDWNTRARSGEHQSPTPHRAEQSPNTLGESR